jgi:hypothetical protein
LPACLLLPPTPTSAAILHLPQPLVELQTWLKEVNTISSFPNMIKIISISSNICDVCNYRFGLGLACLCHFCTCRSVMCDIDRESHLFLGEEWALLMNCKFHLLVSQPTDVGDLWINDMWHCLFVVLKTEINISFFSIENKK